ncbi:MAG: proteasome accessory factor PafA2 family protein [Fimbriimonadaceae bacterium]
MRPILAGIETEYGFSVDGRTVEDLVDDAKALVGYLPGGRLARWDYRHESPRADLRGFFAERLRVDPVDAQFDRGRTLSGQDVRNDQVDSHGARFYNDHGHPEYATPESFSMVELAELDRQGSEITRAAAEAYGDAIQRRVSVYKNNTDFHGASYGTHESYLVPRRIPFERLVKSVMPVLIARSVLCGSGKVGSEGGHGPCDFQITQRADFFTETLGVDTLYRRPVFNTRDEPHAPDAWRRMHVICGDANMHPTATARKVGLVKLVLWLLDLDEAPQWELLDPPRTFRQLSRDTSRNFRMDLAGRNWTDAYSVLEALFAAAERWLPLNAKTRDAGEAKWTIDTSRHLLSLIRAGDDQAGRGVDWVAKRRLLDLYREALGVKEGDPALQAVDLAYHDLDPETGLFSALDDVHSLPFLAEPVSPSRATARQIALQKFAPSIRALSWGSILFDLNGEVTELDLDPVKVYDMEALRRAEDPATYIRIVRETS